LKFADVTAAINPATVRFRSLTEPVALTVLEQNYEYDLLEPEKLLRKYVGREITIVRDRQEGGATRAEEVKALLLAYNNGPVWKIGNEIVTGLRVDQYRFPELPENLFSHPTLVWMLENGGSARHRVEASYLSGGLSWNADYVLTIGRDDKVADLAGWVTLKNQSGTSYRNARLQLIAGEVNRVSGDTIEREAGIARKIGIVAQAPAMQFYYRNQQSPGSPIKSDVKVYYRFKNDERAGLGIPDARRRRSRLPGRLEGRRAVRGRGSDGAHAEGRGAQPAHGQRIRHRVRAEAGGLQAAVELALRDGVRDYASQPQGLGRDDRGK